MNLKLRVDRWNGNQPESAGCGCRDAKPQRIHPVAGSVARVRIAIRSQRGRH